MRDASDHGAALNMPLMRPAGYWQTVGELGTLGFSFVIALAIGTGAGLWIDRQFGSSPWGMLIGFGLGFAAAILNVYRITSRAIANSRNTAGSASGADRDTGTTAP